MKHNRLLLGTLVIGALAAGVYTWNSSLFARHIIEDYLIPRLSRAVHLEQRGRNGIFDNAAVTRHLEKWYASLPAETALSLDGDGEDLRTYALAHPDRPGYYWRWWCKSITQNPHPDTKGERAILPEQPPEVRKWAEKLRDDAKFLREHDPRNARPLLLLAYLEAWESISRGRNKNDEIVGTVINRDRASQAVTRFHQAVESEKFTLYTNDLAEEWFSLLGGAPATFDEALLVESQIMWKQPLPNLFLIRSLCERLVIEAERRAELAEPETGSESMTSIGILLELQTMGARLAIGDSSLLNVLAGYSTIELVTEEGVRVLRANGQEEAADRLLARGRNLLRPLLLARLMGHEVQNTKIRAPYSILENDPSLAAEALRLMELRQQAPVDHFALASNNFLLGMGMSAIRMHWPDTGTFTSLDELNTAARLEYWIWEKFFLCIPIFSACLVLAISAILCIIGVFSAKTNEDDASRSLFGNAILPAFLAALIAAVPGFLAAFSGHSLEISAAVSRGWLLFWNVCGTLAAGWFLGWWFQPRRANGTGPRRGAHDWIAVGGTLLAAVFASIVFVGIWKDRAPAIAVIAAMLLVLLTILVLLTVLHGCAKQVKALLRRKQPDRSAALSWLAALSISVLFLYCARPIAEWQERTWAKRDSLLISHSAAQAVSGGPIGHRMVKLHTDHIKSVLSQ